MTDSPLGQSLALGTMRMLEVSRSQDEWLEFLSKVYSLGYQTLHSSVEYDSFAMLSSVLDRGARQRTFPDFRHIAKLPEPGFQDVGFDAFRLESKVRSYLSALATPVLHDVQWMWRQNLQDDCARISKFQQQLDAIGEAVLGLKRQGLIERFFCFPYSIEFGNIALEHDAIDGIIVYRNAQETSYDALIDRSFVLSKPCHIIRPFNAGAVIGQGNRTHEEHLKFALEKPAIETAILSSNSLDHLKKLSMTVKPSV